MTSNDLTKGYVRKIATELRRAYNFFGECDERFIRQAIKDRIKELWWQVKYGHQIS